MDLHAGTPQNDLHTNNIKEQIKHHETRILQYCLRNSMIFQTLVSSSFVRIILHVNNFKYEIDDFEKNPSLD